MSARRRVGSQTESFSHSSPIARSFFRRGSRMGGSGLWNLGGNDLPPLPKIDSGTSGWSVEVLYKRVLQEIFDLATLKIGDFMSAEGTLLPIDEVPPSAWRALSAVRVTELFDCENRRSIHVGHHYNLRFKNKLKALATLARFLELARDVSLSPPSIGTQDTKKESVRPKRSHRSARRDRFAIEYLKDFNATQAAQRAGYSRKTAASQGQRLLKSPAIEDAIAKGRERILKKSERLAADRLEELIAIALVNPASIFDEGESLLPLSQLPANVRQALEQVTVKTKCPGYQGNKKLTGQQRRSYVFY
jgi:phage terminase small subunit